MIQTLKGFKQDADPVCILFFNGLPYTLDWPLRAALFLMLLSKDQAWIHPGDGKPTDWTSLLLKLPVIIRILNSSIFSWV